MVLLRLEIFRTFSKNRYLGLQQTNDPSIRPSSNLSSQLESLLDRVVLIPQSLFYFRTTRNHEAITFVEVCIFQFGNLPTSTLPRIAFRIHPSPGSYNECDAKN